MDHSSLSPDELHLLYILLDSNLPTGGFVSSSGLEAYVKHGFLGIVSSPSPYDIGVGTDNDERATKDGRTFTAVRGVKDVIRGVTDFAEAEVRHYGHTTGCFVKDSWRSVKRYMTLTPIVNNVDQRTVGDEEDKEVENLKRVIEEIKTLDEYHESSMLSHVARRASKAQGVAMLTLFTRGLSRPVGFDPLDMPFDADQVAAEAEQASVREERSMAIVGEYKRLVRKGAVPGHLAVCWGVITATLGLALGESHSLVSQFHILLGQGREEPRADEARRSVYTPIPLPTRSISPLDGCPDEYYRPLRLFSDALAPFQTDYRSPNYQSHQKRHHHWSVQSHSYRPGRSWEG